MDEWIKKICLCVCVRVYIYIYIYIYIRAHTDTYIHTYIHTMEYYSVLKKKEILPFVTTWMKLEDITLNEIGQTQKDKYCVISHMWNLK